ncbi:MAG: dTDP-4-dehydrorhamnose reductase [Deltaproteobacteria bacterium]|nr:dTDP-4-dehydrorhamnose reductase [Deltaproteobacteria bacterium]MBW2015370.1 dTDP-4-dehydrorhamnose reductase [Deltaproteobacteria bacterium]MBW2127998.1 dTDP-4-dehydrorhamnose reductase [Deltaproteobacteria bacterium]MBW2302577.1 dTDP-4-dehydrorhamnose reductase [Deltaproteobacteria bacterium]
MKILILGGSGMLGSECKGVLEKEHEIVAPSRKELDIISWDMVIDVLNTISPDIVLNCAGFTDVDGCETEDFLVRKVNVEGPRNVAQGCARFDCRMIHISSDYVFNGQKGIPQPYFEDDSTDPISAYGKSKMESEVAVRENAPNYIILRTGWLYGRYGKNFITSLLSRVFANEGKPIKVVSDQIGCPTWTYRLALQIREFINSDARGTYHATSEGYCSRFDFASRILEKLGIKADLEPCSIRDFDLPAARPINCILENRRAKKQGLNIMKDWREDLDLFLEAFGDELIRKAREMKD